MQTTRYLPNVNPGDFYSIQTGKKRFQAVRVIAVESQGLHLTMYRHQFSHRPTSFNLMVAESDTEQSTYVPFRWFSFYAMNPEFLAQVPVNPGELVEYQVWLAEGCVYWGD